MEQFSDPPEYLRHKSNKEALKFIAYMERIKKDMKQYQSSNHNKLVDFLYK
jgi:hypothetical protein